MPRKATTKATTKTATTTKTITSNEQRALIVHDVGISTRDFELILETVTSPIMPSGYDTMYGLKNKQTGVIELRGHSLALSVIVLQNQQQMMDKVRSGEMNGYASVEGKTVASGVEGLL